MKNKSEKNNYDYILKSAVNVAERVGRSKIKFDVIAKEIGIDRSIIYFHFKTTEILKKEVLRYAIEHEVIILLIEAVIFNHIKLSELSASIKKQIIDLFV